MNSSSKVLALVLLLGAPCARAAETAQVEGTVAVVNGEPILLSEYQKEAATNLDFWGRSNPQALGDPAVIRKIREGTLEDLITRELLVQEAKRTGIKVREREVDNAIDEIKAKYKTTASTGADDGETEHAFQQQLKNEGLDYGQFRGRLTRQLTANKILRENVKDKLTPPTEQDGKDYFAKIKAFLASKSTDTPKGMDEDDADALREAARQVKMLSSERVRARRVVIRLTPGATDAEKKRALKTAADIKKRLDAGEDFAKLAKEESEDPESAARGGDIGYVIRGVGNPEIEKAAFALQVGQTSAPILTDFGYNILRVTERKEAEEPDYDRFHDDLMNFLGDMSSRKKLETYVKKLRDGATIERHLPSVP